MRVEFRSSAGTDLPQQFAARSILVCERNTQGGAQCRSGVICGLESSRLARPATGRSCLPERPLVMSNTCGIQDSDERSAGLRCPKPGDSRAAGRADHHRAAVLVRRFTRRSRGVATSTRSGIGHLSTGHDAMQRSAGACARACWLSWNAHLGSKTGTDITSRKKIHNPDNRERHRSVGFECR